ncbi:MAG: transposase [Burkholderiaceae bacterium]|nr:transposase [Burkholderiaceae bacterium]
MTDDLQDLRRRLVVGHKADGRSLYDEKAKAELVALCMQPGASVSRLARECGVNANQVCRWLRERGHVRRPRPPASRAVAMPSPFVAVPVIAATAPVENTAPAVMQLQARLPNGVAIELGGIDVRHVGQVIEALGRLRCSGSTKG